MNLWCWLRWITSTLGKFLTSTSRQQAVVMGLSTMRPLHQAYLILLWEYTFRFKFKWWVIYWFFCLVLSICNSLQAPTAESDDVVEEDVPTFTGRHNGHELHTHAPISHLVCHFGGPASGELRSGENRALMTLAPANASIWLSFTRKAAREILKKMKIKIRNGKIVKN